VGIINRFTGFLSIITSFIPPLAGVIIAAYWIVGKGRKENFKPGAGVNIAGIIAFAAGVATALITTKFPFFVAPINGIVVSIVFYVILIKVIPVKAGKN
jgi:cytosine permease